MPEARRKANATRSKVRPATKYVCAAEYLRFKLSVRAVVMANPLR